MKTYYKLQLDYHPQQEWAAAPMWLEMSYGALGGGLFIFSAFQDNLLGVVLGFLVLMAGKGLFLLADLGKPARFLKVLNRPFKSWISFGAWVFMTFCVAGLVYALLLLTGSAGVFTTLVKLLAIVLASILVVYDGFFLSASAGVAAWHSSSMLPALFGLSALATGAVVAQALGIAVHPYAAGLLFAGLLFAHFAYVKGLASSVQSAKVSAAALVSGELKTAYLWVAVVVGAVVPFLVGILAILGTVSVALSLVAAACAVVGVFALRYSVLKAGVYAPVM